MLTLAVTTALVLALIGLCGVRELLPGWLGPYAVAVSAVGAVPAWSRPVHLGLQTSALVLVAVLAWWNRSVVRRPAWPATPPARPVRDRTVIVPDQYRPRSRDAVSG